MVNTRSTKLSPSLSPPSTLVSPSKPNNSDHESSSSNRRRSKSSPPKVSSPRTYQAKDRRNGIPLATKKQLLKDIESQGGIRTLFGQTHDLNRLLKCNPDLYGEQGSNLRQSCRSFVTQIKKLFKNNEYESRVLKPFGVESFSELQAKKSIYSDIISSTEELVLISTPKLASKKKVPLNGKETHVSSASNRNSSISNSDSSNTTTSPIKNNINDLVNHFSSLGFISPEEKNQLSKKKNEEQTYVTVVFMIFFAYSNNFLLLQSNVLYHDDYSKIGDNQELTT